jgi:uncharacterized membrane protein
MWLHWLFNSPSTMWPSSCFNSLSFICLLCHPFSLPHYQNISCLFLIWSSSLLHDSTLWCSEPPRVKDHHLDLQVCIFIASLHVWLFSFFIVGSIMVLINCNTRRTRHGNIKYVPRIRTFSLLFMTNAVCIIFFTLGLLVSLAVSLT